MMTTSTQSTALFALMLLAAAPVYAAETTYTDEEQPVSRLPNISYQGTLLRSEKPRKKTSRKFLLLSLDYDNGIRIQNNRMFFPIMGETSGMLSLSHDRIKIKLFTGNENTRIVLRGDKKKVYLRFKYYF